MIGNPFYPRYPYIPIIPVPQTRVTRLGIYELPTTNVSLSETSVDYGINACIYNELPCECFISLQLNQNVPVGGEDLPITVVTPTSGRSTNTGTPSTAGETKTNVIDHNSENVVGSDVIGSKEVFAFLNKREGLIRFVNFQTGGTTT